ncbi:ectonucleotide pyrophosphatase/phosphodiesterase family member 3-like [Paramacrobiotus metropolitanus]|uniref:ectonucleotide pyrophosphatase/phosphodiesterase family member 3-like n=1 Tax=Paramacrobiotus metropolitanus TaxID=2943436 RepID=UPI002445697E|nr:ectonucleotide pyrophosphatase/phosphodiesterase family member 3-like [Paramacrobiotus metropolitanus]
MPHDLENDPTAIALSGNHLHTHPDWTRGKQKRKWIRILLVIIACVVFLLIGLIIGLFIPRDPATSISESNETSTAPSTTVTSAGNATSWRKTPCTAPDNSQCPKGYRERPPLLVVSTDGFRAEYLSRQLTPALERIRSCGVSAPSMRPTHPAITFPNHYSIATGLFAESHGIVDNTFYDPILKAQFNYKSSESVGQSRWWNGEPIWVTARKQGKRANAYFWVGTEAEIQGYRPNVYLPFNGSTPFEDRVDAVLSWLSSPDDLRPDVTMLYFEEPDSGGHRYGTQSPQVNASLDRMNSVFDRLMQGLHDRDILPCVNIILVSDHGMEDADCDKAFYLVPMLQNNSATSSLTSNDIFVYGGVHARISLKETSPFAADDLYAALQCPAKTPSSSFPPYQIYKKEQLPRRLHYTNTPRVEPLVMNLKARSSVYASQNPMYTCTGVSGIHGYDNLYESQQSIFMAMGPSIKSAVEIEPFRNVELYNFMCDLLNISPASNNGTYGSLHGLLKERKSAPTVSKSKVDVPIFPQSEAEFASRGDDTCSPAQACFTGSMAEADMSLNISNAESVALLAYHAPFGVPQFESSEESAIRLLVNPDYIVAYDVARQRPIWSSFRIQPNSTRTLTNPPSLDCIRTDVRLVSSDKPTCQALRNASFGTKPANLVPSGTRLSGINNIQLISNMIPMFDNFRNGVWKSFWNVVNGWIDHGWKLNVQLGPLFDHQYPYGVADTENTKKSEIHYPSHFYVIVTRDNRKTQCVGKECLTDILAFMLPHSNDVQHCQDDRSYILTNSATVTDIESATMMRFYTDLPVYESIRLRTLLRTKLWGSESGL